MGEGSLYSGRVGDICGCLGVSNWSQTMQDPHVRGAAAGEAGVIGLQCQQLERHLGCRGPSVCGGNSYNRRASGC